jgi:hypothetical protein
MSGPDFFQTGMGRTFYEGTMPALVRELRKLNENLEKGREVALYGSQVQSKADREALGLAMPKMGHPPGWYDNFLHELAREATRSGEAAAVLVGDHLMDVWEKGKDEVENTKLAVEELENIVEWANSIKKKLADEL